MNPKTRVIIVDDDERSRNVIRMMLEQHVPGVEVIDTASNQDEAYALITTRKPDLVFMDIQLQEGDCFSILNRFAEIDFEVIFITAHDEYALQAIRFSALDYILKPVDPDDLIHAMNKYFSKNKLRNSQLRISNLRDNLSGKTINKIALPSQTDIQFIDVNSIVRVEAEKNYSIFHLVGNKKIMVSKTLKDYEDMLLPFGFFRIHQSHLINMNRVDRYVKGRGGYAVMNDGISLEVSVRKKDEFMTMLRQFAI